MSFGFRAKEKPSLRDRFRGKSSDQILEELRKKMDQDKEMLFDRTPNPPGFRRAGFPFDDHGPRGRPDFRHRLEELAQQHPEFADSLRPWYTDAPPSDDMGWTFRQRTGSGSGSNAPSNPDQAPSPQQAQQPEGRQEEKEEAKPQPADVTSRGIPQHGLRNTVDIGEAQQAHAQMDSNDDERGKRAQSAPPDNPSKEPQRFVSRLEINPTPEQSAAQDSSATKPPVAPKQPQQSQQASKPASNVRQIPIFVEGRDEPVLAKHDVDSAPSNFGQPFGHHSFSSQNFNRPGGIHDNLRFGDAPRYTSSMHHNFNSEPQAQKRPFPQQQQQPPPSRHPSRSQMKDQAQPQPQQHREDTPPASSPTPPKPSETPKPKEPIKPKDALVKVQEVQKEVQELAERVDAFSGQRQDKQYLLLDELLTCNLIKLDVIETEGREDVRAARKEAIRAIQQCISNLEAKVMTPEEKEAKEKAELAMETEEQPQTTEVATEVMEAEPSQNLVKTENETPPTVVKETISDASMEGTCPVPVTSSCQETPTSSTSPEPAACSLQAASDDTSKQQPMDVTSVTSTTNAASMNNSSSAPES